MNIEMLEKVIDILKNEHPRQTTGQLRGIQSDGVHCYCIQGIILEAWRRENGGEWIMEDGYGVFRYGKRTFGGFITEKIGRAIGMPGYPGSMGYRPAVPVSVLEKAGLSDWIEKPSSPPVKDLVDLAHLNDGGMRFPQFLNLFETWRDMQLKGN